MLLITVTIHWASFMYQEQCKTMCIISIQSMRVGWLYICLFCPHNCMSCFITWVAIKVIFSWLNILMSMTLASLFHFASSLWIAFLIQKLRLFLITLKGRKGSFNPCTSGSAFQLLTLLHGVIITVWSCLVTFTLTSCLEPFLLFQTLSKLQRFFVLFCFVFKEGQHYLLSAILGHGCSISALPTILKAFPPAESEATQLTKMILPLYPQW